MEIEQMTPEQIQDYLNKMQNPDTQETEQAPAQSPATGVYNPGDYDLQKMFVNQQNEKYKNKSGTFTPAMSLSKGDSFQKYLDKKLTPELQQELFADIQSVADRQAGKGYQLNKHDLREVEAAFKAKHPEIKRLDISGWRGFDKAMASDLNQIVQTKKPEEKPNTPTQPAKTTETPAATKPTATPPQETEKPKGKQVENSNKGVAGAQVGDYIVRKNGETHVITQADIDWAKKRVGEQQPAQTSDAMQGDPRFQAHENTANVAPSTGTRNTEIEKPYTESVSEADRDALWEQARQKYPDNYEAQQNWVENQLAQMGRAKSQKKQSNTNKGTGKVPDQGNMGMLQSAQATEKQLKDIEKKKKLDAAYAEADGQR